MNPMYYLLKTEPTVYSFDDLEKEGTTVWDGVNNPVALKNLRGMKHGDGLVIYHTGNEKSAVGTASVVSVAAEAGKPAVVTIQKGRKLATPITLAQIKADKRFSDSPLVHQGRLSVVPLTEEQYRFITG